MPKPIQAVIDTNLVLDLFVFRDPLVEPLMLALLRAELQWIATDAMRKELARVLTYPQIAKVLDARNLGAAEVLEQASQSLHLVPMPNDPNHRVRCRDRDDQIFVDLAVAHEACLLSKDRAVLSLTKSLLRWNVRVLRKWQ